MLFYMQGTMLILARHQNVTALCTQETYSHFEVRPKKVRENYGTNVLLVSWEREKYIEIQKRKTMYGFRNQVKLHEDDVAENKHNLDR